MKTRIILAEAIFTVLFVALMVVLFKKGLDLAGLTFVVFFAAYAVGFVLWTRRIPNGEAIPEEEIPVLRVLIVAAIDRCYQATLRDTTNDKDPRRATDNGRLYKLPCIKARWLKPNDKIVYLDSIDPGDEAFWKNKGVTRVFLSRKGEWAEHWRKVEKSRIARTLVQN